MNMCFRARKLQAPDPSLPRSYSNPQPEQVSTVAQALQHNTNLTSLDLRSNKSGAAGVRAISSACYGLISLHLGDNQLGDAAASEVARLLETENASLQKLNLSNNGISDDGVVLIVKSLTNPNLALSFLSLSGNGITKRGVAALGALLHRQHCTLKELILNDNPIGDGGAAAIASGLEKLEKLHLSGCGIQEAGALALASAVATTSCGLLLGRNAIGAHARRILQNVVERRSWSWSKEKVLWCGYHGKSPHGFALFPPEVMNRLVILCRETADVPQSCAGLRQDSFPVVVRDI